MGPNWGLLVKTHAHTTLVNCGQSMLVVVKQNHFCSVPSSDSNLGGLAVGLSILKKVHHFPCEFQNQPVS